MRKHGWQLPYHPLQVVAVAVFLALGFAFYVFFAPFVGKKLFQYIVMGIYTPLLVSSFGLYIWCAGADPADPGVFRSKKYLNIPEGKKLKNSESKHGGQSTSSIQEPNAATNSKGADDKKGNSDIESATNHNTENERTKSLVKQSTCCMSMLATLLFPCAYVCRSHEESSQHSEDGMFYCSLCEVEVFKYSKHCRVCDKCVDCFDHHCRWLNNCIGKRNYRKFFALMVSALLLLVLQWSTGILVIILCFLEKKRFTNDISIKLGSSFTIVPYVIVVAVCTILAMIATLPLAQLFFFHILLIKKGISTYDYIIALREQDQQDVGGQQSPQMSQVSSLTGLSSVSSFNTFNRAAWCTPPRLFVEDQYDVVPPDNVSVSSYGKKATVQEEPTKKKNPSAVKISPWTLARLNAEEVSKAASEARKKSKILRPVAKRDPAHAVETDSSLGSSGRKMSLKLENSNKKRGSRRIRLPSDIPLESLSKIPGLDTRSNMDHHYHHQHHMNSETSTSMAPLHLEARSDFRESSSQPIISGSAGVITSSPESSLESPDINPFSVSSSGLLPTGNAVAAHLNDIPLSRSTSDGYDASGGEDSDQVPRRIQYRPTTNWSSLLFGNEADRAVPKYAPPSSSATSNHHRKI